MKCPRCGADMKEGQMYCEHCGREIQIVPEFDPALETSLHKALSDVGTQIAEKASEDSKPETDAGQSTVPEKQPSMKNRRKKRRPFCRSSSLRGHEPDFLASYPGISV